MKCRPGLTGPIGATPVVTAHFDSYLGHTYFFIKLKYNINGFSVLLE